jgi:hypothetical protein
MLPKIFYRSRFRKLAATYGANIDLWPEHDRAHARAFIARCPQKAKADLAAAQQVDAWLMAKAPPAVSEDSQWRAFGALMHMRSLVDEAAIAPAAETAETIIFSPLETGAKDAKSAKGQSMASLEIREERARMIAKERKVFGKGLLKFQ